VLIGEGVRVILTTIDKADPHGFTPGEPAFLTTRTPGKIAEPPASF
jgi:hypothetical protein